MATSSVKIDSVSRILVSSTYITLTGSGLGGFADPAKAVLASDGTAVGYAVDSVSDEELVLNLETEAGDKWKGRWTFTPAGEDPIVLQEREVVETKRESNDSPSGTVAPNFVFDSMLPGEVNPCCPVR